MLHSMPFGAPARANTPASLGADRARWLVRSSKPLWGVTSLPGGFDSHAPSPVTYNLVSSAFPRS